MVAASDPHVPAALLKHAAQFQIIQFTELTLYDARIVCKRLLIVSSARATACVPFHEAEPNTRSNSKIRASAALLQAWIDGDDSVFPPAALVTTIKPEGVHHPDQPSSAKKKKKATDDRPKPSVCTVFRAP